MSVLYVYELLLAGWSGAVADAASTAAVSRFPKPNEN